MSSPGPRLLRGIGRWSLVALVINITIGGGIFGLPSKVYGLVGVYSLLTYVACAALIGLIALCFAVSILYNVIGLGLALAGRLTPLATAILMPVSSLTVIGLAAGLLRRGARELPA